jgi:pyruvate formate lyase activating enzyme
MTTQGESTAVIETAATDVARIFDIQRLSIHDGPGIRTTVFFKGCLLHCAWCQNPESIDRAKQLLIDSSRCIGCGTCAKVCSHRDGCIACGSCADVCPVAARRIAGRDIRVEQLLKEIIRDKAFYAGGGVTFGGGEPLLQWPFVKELARALRREGIHTAIDTSGYTSAEIREQVPSEIDLAIVDLKLIDNKKHKCWTGRSNAPILNSIRHWADKMPERLWISLPVIPGVHDKSEIDAIADFIESLPNKVPVRLIPYSRFGESKYGQLGKEVPAFEGNTDALMEYAGKRVSAKKMNISI